MRGHRYDDIHYDMNLMTCAMPLLPVVVYPCQHAGSAYEESNMRIHFYLTTDEEVPNNTYPADPILESVETAQRRRRRAKNKKC